MKDDKGERGGGREGKGGGSGDGWFGAIQTWPGQTKAFLGDVRAETQRVTWPTRKQIRVTTIVVIVTVFFFGFYFFLLDYVFGDLIGRLLQWGG
ncbi:MAG: preprotein translocase subunit SecE [Terriglobia bacterium]